MLRPPPPCVLQSLRADGAPWGSFMAGADKQLCWDYAHLKNEADEFVRAPVMVYQ